MKYDMVFEGGGAKGMVFVGAMQAFEAQKHTHDRLLGTSAGAITAALLAAGYTSGEMADALAEKTKEGRSVFADFMGMPQPLDQAAIKDSATRQLLRNINLPLIPDRFEDQLDDRLVEWLAAQPSLRHVFSFIEEGGWYAADSFLSWLRRRLDAGNFNGQPRHFSGLTLAQFYAETAVDLSLIASDTTAQEMLVLNHRTAPDLPLVWAVRMSMSIPLLWQEVVWQAGWGRYRAEGESGKEMTGHTIVDGGLLSNFPLELFVSSDPQVIDVMGPKGSDRVLGMLIDESLPVSGAEQVSKPEFGLGELHTVQRISNLLNTSLQAHDKMVIEAFENLVVHLPAKGYGTTEFDMTDERRALLVKAGQEAMQAYLDKQPAAPEALSFGLMPSEAADPARRAVDKLALKRLGKQRQAQ